MSSTMEDARGGRPCLPRMAALPLAALALAGLGDPPVPWPGPAAAAAQRTEPLAGERDTTGRAAWLPWDTLSVAAADGLGVLDRELDLARRGEVGEERAYEIRRTNVNLDRIGRPLSRIVAEGTVRATLLREVSRGRWEERFVWERFAVGQSAGGSDEVALREVPAASGIEYTVKPGGLDVVNPGGDFARLGGGVEAVLMKVLAVDMHTWNALVLGMRDDLGDTVAVGADAGLTGTPEAVDLMGPDGSEPMGTFRFGERRAAVAGLTRWAGEPCVMIWFSMQGNRVTQHIDGPPMTLEMQGTEYFSGVLTLSLRDGRIVAGRLWGLVPSRMEIALPGQSVREQPIFSVHQEVVMWELGRRER